MIWSPVIAVQPHMAFFKAPCALLPRQRAGAPRCGSTRACAHPDSVTKAGLSPDCGLQDKASRFGFQRWVLDPPTRTLTLTLSRQRESEPGAARPEFAQFRS